LDKSSYLDVLHHAIDSVVKGQTSDANLSLSNFYYKPGCPSKENYLSILKWTLDDTVFRTAEDGVKRDIAQFLYSLDTRLLGERDGISIKGDDYLGLITKRSE
jgi:hypothetical protein